MAQVIFVHDGDTIDYTPTTDIAAGAVVEQGELVGVATQPIKAGQLGSLAVAGVFDFRVDTPSEWSVGDLAYYFYESFVTRTNEGTRLVGKVVLVDSRPGPAYEDRYVRVLMTQ
jgi:predicted RecA/RadA family phage recombinase